MARILIIDDSEELLTILSLILQKHGHETRTANNKNNLSYLISSFLPEVILLDVILNRINGRRLCNEIKRTDIGKNIPVILMSASPDLLRNYNSCKADDILEKPFDITTIDEKINALLALTHT
jgi:DNA-binding response OmpR family regulator